MMIIMVVIWIHHRSYVVEKFAHPNSFHVRLTRIMVVEAKIKGNQNVQVKADLTARHKIIYVCAMHSDDDDDEDTFLRNLTSA